MNKRIVDLRVKSLRKFTNPIESKSGKKKNSLIVFRDNDEDVSASLLTESQRVSLAESSMLPTDFAGMNFAISGGIAEVEISDYDKGDVLYKDGEGKDVKATEAGRSWRILAISPSNERALSTVKLQREVAHETVSVEDDLFDY